VNGRQALDFFVSVKPDLIVSDIMMPEMDGFELLEEVRSLPHGVTMPFLFLTARTERTDVKKARSLGVDDYLFKPFDAWELIEAVRTRLNRRKAVELFDTRAAHLQTVVMLGNVIEARDPYTAGHVDRVRRLALSLCFPQLECRGDRHPGIWRRFARYWQDHGAPLRSYESRAFG